MDIKRGVGLTAKAEFVGDEAKVGLKLEDG